MRWEMKMFDSVRLKWHISSLIEQKYLFHCTNEKTLVICFMDNLGQKKELCLSFLKVKTLSAMRFFFFSQKELRECGNTPYIFFYCIFRPLFFFSRPLRGPFLTFFSISREKKMKKNWKSLKNLKNKKKMR